MVLPNWIVIFAAIELLSFLLCGFGIATAISEDQALPVDPSDNGGRDVRHAHWRRSGSLELRLIGATRAASAPMQVNA